MLPSFDGLKDEYGRLWSTAVTRSSFKPAVEASAKRILASKERYETVASMTNVPWYVVGLIHQMEAGCRFTCHLHNGDPLSAKTVHVPKGRPKKGTPVFPWEDSACDALLMHGLNKITDWPVERICFELEGYNGWGYRKYHPTTLTPYLWSGTTLYARGKYVADGKWSSVAVSGQSGAMPILKKLVEIDPTIVLRTIAQPAENPAPAQEPLPAPVVETTPDSFSKANEKQFAWWHKALALLGLGGLTGQEVPSPDAFMDTLNKSQGYAPQIKSFLTSGLIGWAILAAVLYVLIGYVMPRLFGSDNS